VPVQPTDGDILWVYDMLSELDVWPQDAADCSVLVHGDYVYVCTSNGVDKSHRNVPSPEAPDLIVLDKKTGRLVAVNHPTIGKAIFHGEWSSPSLGVVGGKTLIFFGGGDGVCYAFDAQPPASTGTKPAALTKVWSFDCNPPENKFKDGKPIPYNRGKGGPSEIMATPVFRDGRVYVTVGQDSNHGPGRGCLSCIDASKKGDITQTGKVWQCTKVQRAFSTASVAGNLVFQADFTGFVHCLDAATGSVHWSRDLGAHVFASTLVAGGKVYVADETGTLTILAAAKEEKVLGEIRFGEPIFATPVIANGVLYVATKGHLVALQGQ
jgi:outer membrane protein assembly factor BamB